MSNQMQLIEPYQHCDKCDNNGFIIKNGSAVRCECWIKYRERLSLLKRMLDANLVVEESSREEVEKLISYSLKDYKGNDMSGNIPKIRKYIDKFEERFRSVNLFFTGTNGTQKSTLARYMVLELIRKGFSAYYTITKDFIDVVMASERDELKAEKLDRILKVDFLVLDEFSPDKIAMYNSGYKQSIITSPIKKRFETIRKATIVISNKTLTELKNGEMGMTLSDLIDRETKNGCQLTFTDNYGDYARIDLSSIWDN